MTSATTPCRLSVRLLLALLLGVSLGCSAEEPASPQAPQAPPQIRTTDQESGTGERLIGIAAVSESVAWASGTGGVVARTVDGGATWTAATVPGADTLQFRDVWAAGPDTAYVLSIGPGAASRIYKTTDGGSTWALSFANDTPEAFFDCMDFWDAGHGLAFSDAVDGSFVVVRTEDGGETWDEVPAGALPPAQEGEASFAASGTCLVARGDSTALFSTGAADTARVYRTTDRGRTWTAAPTPVEAGAPAAGIASLAFRTADVGVALGGVMTVDSVPDSSIASTARTGDGGRTWTEGAPALPGVFGSAYVPDTDPPLLVAVGPQGMTVSVDDGRSWSTVGNREHWSVAFASASAGWAVGPEGRITKLEVAARSSE